MEQDMESARKADERIRKLKKRQEEAKEHWQTERELLDSQVCNRGINLLFALQRL